MKRRTCGAPAWWISDVTCSRQDPLPRLWHRRQLDVGCLLDPSIADGERQRSPQHSALTSYCAVADAIAGAAFHVSSPGEMLWLEITDISFDTNGRPFQGVECGNPRLAVGEIVINDIVD